MKYRADIDGLRALAVVPVLFYHAGVPGFPGGFVGVDIFFVISGYLICGMIDQGMRGRSFSLGDFYKRRILRIVPPLFVMLLVTSMLAYIYCLPVEFEDYSKSLASAAGSVFNVYFAANAGYAPAETKPLLHTWSFGVEEQFYLITPLLMMLCYRFVPKQTGLLFAVAAAVSLVAAFVISYRNETFIFYLTPFRFPARVAQIGAYPGYDPSVAFRLGRCYLSGNRQQLDVETCLKLDTKRPNYLLVGDSHAAHLWLGLSSLMPQINGLSEVDAICLQRFSGAQQGRQGSARRVVERRGSAALSAMLEALKQKGLETVVFGPIVEYDSALPRLLADEILHGDPTAASAMRTLGIRERDRVMSRLVTASGATYLSVYDAVCRDGSCDEFAEGDVPMQFDEGHLTAMGSVEVARRLSAAFVNKLARADDVSN
jgi:hypothetical protein